MNYSKALSTRWGPFSCPDLRLQDRGILLSVSMKKALIAIPVAALASSVLLVGCGDTTISCESMGSVALQSIEYPLPLKPGGGGGTGGRGGSSGGSRSGGSYGQSKPKPAAPRPQPKPAKPPQSGNTTIINHPPGYRGGGGSDPMMPFIGGLLVGDALSDGGGGNHGGGNGGHC